MQITTGKSLFALLLMVVTAVLANQAKPKDEVVSFPNSRLENIIPKSFSKWNVIESFSPVLPNPELLQAIDAIYSDTLARSYINTDGKVIMLSLAYGRKQNDTMRVHRPEGCYSGQGFTVNKLPLGSLRINEKNFPVVHLNTKLGNRSETVTYWTVIGGKHATSQTEMKIAQLRFGLTGFIPDGLIFRVSSINLSDEAAFDLAEVFINDLMDAVPNSVQTGLMGI